MPLEHINITVENASEFAGRLCEYFNWKVRWEGQGKLGGKTIHVGDDHSYLALWTPVSFDDAPSYNAINHIGVVVDDLDATDAKVARLASKLIAMQIMNPGAASTLMTQVELKSKLFHTQIHSSQKRAPYERPSFYLYILA